MSVNLSPVGGASAQFLDNNGNPLSGGKLYAYGAGTTTPQTTYTSISGNIAHTNPIILDSTGRVPGGELWATESVKYKFVLENNVGMLIATWDNIEGINDQTDLLTQLASDSGSSLIGYIAAGSNAVATTVQAKFRAQLSIHDFMTTAQIEACQAGTSTDDDAAFTSFIAACVAQNKSGFLPQGQYMIEPFNFTAEHTGLELTGEAYNPQSPIVPGPGKFGFKAAVLKLRTASPAFFTFGGELPCYQMKFSSMHHDGAGIADIVHLYPGVANVTNLVFDTCGIYGAKNATGITIRFDGALGGDQNFYIYCDINGAPGQSTIIPLNHIYNSNTNGFRIWFDGCHFQNAETMFRYGEGSCSISRSEMFGAKVAVFAIDSVTQDFSISDCYHEQSDPEGVNGIPFFIQYGAAGVYLNRWITIERCTINSDYLLRLNCQQPVRIVTLSIGGDIDVTPIATYGIAPIIVDGLTFLGTAKYTGAGYNTNVIEIGGIDSTTFDIRKANFPNGALIEGLTVGKGKSGLNNNTAVGFSSLDNVTTGNDNTAVGSNAGLSITTGARNTFVGNIIADVGAGLTGNNNVAVGRGNMRGGTTASNNTLVGGDAGNSLTTGDSNTFIGYNATASAVSVFNEIIVGANLTGKGTQTAFIGGTSGAFNGNNVSTWAVISDKRIKRNIVDTHLSLNTILNIQVRDYNYRLAEDMPLNENDEFLVKNFDSDKLITGPIAQELQQVMPECVTEQSTGLLTIHTDCILWALVKSVQELKAELDNLKNS